MTKGDTSEVGMDDGGESARAPRLIVGLGASAGGLDALEEFFANTPPDAGLAFVVVTHQHPDHVSLLPELLARHTAMPVVGVSEETRVEANHVYVAPPGESLGIIGGWLHAFEAGESVARHLLIDFFFRSLAQEVAERAVGVVLSGTGSDGSLGVKAIKEAGGLTLVQTPDSAQYRGMPMSALSTRCIDYSLPVEALPHKLVEYARQPPRTPENLAGNADGRMQRIFVLLRARTGHDFSAYKRSTLTRRIERRMSLHHIDSIENYVRLLQATPGELDSLFKELLIGVTSMFRDPEVFAVLAQEVLPELMQTRAEGHMLRVWVAGCSTGEEAYTLAMVLHECVERYDRRLAFQIFATDIDAGAIEVARAGVYPEGIAGDVSEARLERFFIREEGSYRVRTELRENVVFAAQNLIDDPPFTKIDLLSCRNVLIYLDANLQRRLLPIFHYALRPGGILLLGSSESIGSYTNLFETLDKKWKIFRRREVASGIPLTELLAKSDSDLSATHLVPGATGKGPRPSLTHVIEQTLLNELVPPTVVVDAQGEVAYIHRRTGLFLEPAQGSPDQANLFEMARGSLSVELNAALREAARQVEPLVRRGVRVETYGGSIRADLHVQRLDEPASLRGLFLVSFLVEETGDAQGEVEEMPAPSDRCHELEEELRSTRDYHQSAIEELQTANEELESTNEELHSTNEELQSANEELETSKEEVLSLNEELRAVNLELHDKVEALSRLNDDMQNLLNGTDIATIFLDNELNIKWYTQRATTVINLIPSDLGRPIGDLVSKLEYDDLVEDASKVLDTLVYRELEVHSRNGNWYLMRIVPYRTSENVIEGLVITFADVTRIRRLEGTFAQLRRVLESSPTTVYGQDAELRFVWAYGSVLGRPVEEILGRTDADLTGPEQAEELATFKRGVLDTGVAARQRFDLRVDDDLESYYVHVEPVLDGEGQRAIACVLTKLMDEDAARG